MRTKTKVKRVIHRVLPNSITGKSKVKVGFPIGVSNDIVMRAIYNNFGTTSKNGNVHIPERPFMDNAFRDNKSKYKSLSRKSAVSVMNGRTKVESVVAKIGLVAQNDIKDEIRNLRNPANSDSTIKAKGSSNPLVDNGEMLGAVTFEVFDD